MTLFIALLVLLALGVPVAICIGGSALLTAVLGGFPPLTIIFQRATEGIMSFPLLALPLFILAGEIMSYGCTPRILRFANMILGKRNGGIGSVTVATSAFFGAVCGSAAATSAAVGGLVGPEMTKQKYPKGYTASLIAASGGIGILIPPSVPMVIYCITAEVSIGKMFIAGVIPGLLLALIYIVYNKIVSKRKGWGVQDTHQYTFKEGLKIFIDAIPPLLMPVFVLGGTLSGIVTPTESAIVAVVYSALLAGLFYRELNLQDLFKCCSRTITTSGILLFIIAMASSFSWMVSTTGLPSQVASAFLSISNSKFIIVSLVLLLLVFLGTFMDTGVIILLTTPILLPIMKALGFNPIHYGIILVVTIIIGGSTPPLAVGLYTGCRIMGIELEDAIPDIFYFIGLQLLALVILTIFPQISLCFIGS